MGSVFQYIGSNIIDVLVYGAIAIVTLIGFLKCIFPVMRVAACLKSAASGILRDPAATDATGTPRWQNSLFLGKRLECAWNRFLSNAIQLDARGLTCNVDDYINDDSTIYAVGHMQLSEIVPGLLTSIGILGTFIGLIRGLGGLDLNAGNEQLVDSISNMVSGMTFAFSTSVAGVACSLCFNIICKTVNGSAVKALDNFQDTFSEIVMQRPVDDSVRMIIQQEDQSVMLRHGVDSIAERVSSGIVTAVEGSLAPVSSSISRFIAGETQSQIEGLNAIVHNFILKLNEEMSGQLLSLGETLSEVNREQQINIQSIDQTLSSVENMMNSLKGVQTATEYAGKRLSAMIDTLSEHDRSNDDFLRHSSEILSGMMASAQEQSDLLAALENSQQTLKNDMKNYAEWSGRVLNAVSVQQNGTEQLSGSIMEGMRVSADALREAYTALTGSFASSTEKTLSSFEQQMGRLLSAALEKADEIRSRAGMASSDPSMLISECSALQNAVRDLTGAINRLNGKTVPEVL